MKNFKECFRPNIFSMMAFGIAIYAFAPNMQFKSVSVAVDKMNVFYIGVENPITVAVEGIPDEVVNVHSDQVKLEKTGQGKYKVIATRPGTAKIMVYGDGFEPQELEFRVKRIPEPIVGLQAENGTFWLNNEISAENFRKLSKLDVLMENFDFDSNGKILSYKITRVPNRNESATVNVTMDDEDSFRKSKALIEAAQTGDVYYITDVKGKLPGDSAVRLLNSLVYKIQ